MTGVDRKAETTEDFILRLQQTSLDLLHGDIETTEFALRRTNKVRIFLGAFLLLFVSIEVVDFVMHGFPTWTSDAIRSRIYHLASYVGILIVLFNSTRDLQSRLVELTDRLEAMERGTSQS